MDTAIQKGKLLQKFEFSVELKYYSTLKTLHVTAVVFQCHYIVQNKLLYCRCKAL